MRGTALITLTLILSRQGVSATRQGRGGIRAHPVRHTLRVGLFLMAALAVALTVGCGSESVPEPAPVPTPTAIPLAAPTATPSAPSADRSPERTMAPNFSLPSAGGNDVSLSGLLEDHKAVVLVFYRGYF